MSLVYLVTSLPRFAPDRPSPISRAEFVRRARLALEGADREQLELLLLWEEVDESSRILAQAQAEEAEPNPAELLSRLRTERRPTEGGPALDELPEWILEPAPRHVWLRHYYHHLYDEGGPFLLAWARFAVDLEEVLTGLVAQREQLARDQFLAQMEGHFDTSSELIVGRFDKPDLGLGRRFPWLPRVISALDHHDPVSTERALDDLRWEQIEELMGTDLFTLEYVLGTYLKIRILERREAWTTELGRERFEAMLKPPPGLFDEAAKRAPQGGTA